MDSTTRFVFLILLVFAVTVYLLWKSHRKDVPPPRDEKPAPVPDPVSPTVRISPGLDSGNGKAKSDSEGGTSKPVKPEEPVPDNISVIFEITGKKAPKTCRNCGCEYSAAQKRCEICDIPL